MWYSNIVIISVYKTVFLASEQAHMAEEKNMSVQLVVSCINRPQTQSVTDGEMNNLHQVRDNYSYLLNPQMHKVKCVAYIAQTLFQNYALWLQSKRAFRLTC